MARFNEILVGRYNRSLQKLLSMKGEPPSPQLSSEIIPVLPIPVGVEYRFLETWTRFGKVFTQAGAAGNISMVRLRNPASSNIVGVVEKITIAEAAGDSPRLGVVAVAVDLTTSATGNRLDGRAGVSSSGLIFSGGTVAGGFLSNPGTASWVGVISTAAGTTTLDAILTDDQELTVLPGDALHVEGSTANQAITVSIWWRERYLEESERQ